ncbi:MAG: hypothetical protein KF819_25090 [Labilithrix sp.]|nr:hypothetical protein [Labilithrix sp.]
MKANAAAALLALALAGCSSVGGSAIRTGPVQLPSYSGPVAIYATGQPPPGAVDLGVVEVHAAQQEASVDTLMPQFVRKVAQIGGNVAVVDGIRARFELVGRTHVETFYYQCALGATCAGTRVYAANDELMMVSIFGRAFSTEVVPPGEQPLIPLTPPTSIDPGTPETMAPQPREVPQQTQPGGDL